MLFPQSTALGIIPPSDVCDVIDPWRRKYEPLAVHFPPHITLVYPPFIQPEEWPVFSLELADCLASVEPFEIRLEQIELFKGFPMALWILPVDQGQLAGLRTELEGRFPHQIQALPFDYTPHLSVGTFNDLAALEAARSAVEAAWQPQQFLVDRVFFLVQQAGGRWSMRDFLRIGKPA